MIASGHPTVMPLARFTFIYAQPLTRQAAAEQLPIGLLSIARLLLVRSPTAAASQSNLMLSRKTSADTDPYPTTQKIGLRTPDAS